MKRSESDRFIGDHSRHEQDVSAEVYLILPDGDRRGLLIRWPYLVVAIAVCVAAAALLVTSGGPRGRSSSAPTRPAGSAQLSPTASTSVSSCVGGGGYGGLGARANAFDANNNDSTGPGEPSPGTAFYVVTAIARGCVTAFAVQDSTTPALTARDLLALVSHPFLPADAKRVVNTGGCEVWKSRALMRATGQTYARATALAQAGSIPGTAQITATSNSAC